MALHLPTAVLAACLTFSAQDPSTPGAPPAGEGEGSQVQEPAAPPSSDARVAEALLSGREPGASPAALVERLHALGESAAPALLDAYVFARVVRDPLQPELDLALSEAERAAVAAAVARMDRAALCALAKEALARPGTALRTRALAALELVGRADELELALSIAATAEEGGPEAHAAQAQLECAV